MREIAGSSSAPHQSVNGGALEPFGYPRLTQLLLLDTMTPSTRRLAIRAGFIEVVSNTRPFRVHLVKNVVSHEPLRAWSFRKCVNRNHNNNKNAQEITLVLQLNAILLARLSWKSSLDYREFDDIRRGICSDTAS